MKWAARLKLRRLTYLPGGDLHRQRSALAVSNQVELGFKPASAAAQSVIGGFVCEFVLVPGETF